MSDFSVALDLVDSLHQLAGHIISSFKYLQMPSIRSSISNAQDIPVPEIPFDALQVLQSGVWVRVGLQPFGRVFHHVQPHRDVKPIQHMPDLELR
jgi:hypothetical protein